MKKNTWMQFAFFGFTENFFNLAKKISVVEFDSCPPSVHGRFRLRKGFGIGLVESALGTRIFLACHNGMREP